MVSSVQSVTFLRKVTMMQRYSPPHKRTYTQHFTVNKLDVKMFDQMKLQCFPWDDESAYRMKMDSGNKNKYKEKKKFGVASA